MAASGTGGCWLVISGPGVILAAVTSERQAPLGARPRVPAEDTLVGLSTCRRSRAARLDVSKAIADRPFGVPAFAVPASAMSRTDRPRYRSAVRTDAGSGHLGRLCRTGRQVGPTQAKPLDNRITCLDAGDAAMPHVPTSRFRRTSAAPRPGRPAVPRPDADRQRGISAAEVEPATVCSGERRRSCDIRLCR